MAISDRLNKLTTDITNAYTSIENKGGTIPSDKNTDNLHTAIDSIEVIESATAEGESLSLTNTKAMPYSDYVVEGKSEQSGEPSPSNPSEIHSVADDVNLFNKEASVLGSANCTYTYENGVYTITNTNSYNPVLILSNILPKGSYILNSDNYLSVATQIRNSNGDTLANCGFKYQNKTFKISSDADRIYFNWATTSNPITLNLNSLKIQKGSTATPYSPYNQGTVTIKQRGTTENNDYTIQTEPLRSLPNGVKDTLEADGIHRRVRVKVFTGDSNTEGWSLNNFPNQIDTMCAQIRFSKSVSKQNENGLLCDKLKKKILYSLDEEGIDCYTAGGGFVIRINRDRLSSEDLAGLRAYLQSNPITVQYKLAEEIIEPLTQNQATTMLDIIKTGSYEGTTNIYTDEDVKPTIGVGYYKKG